MDKNILAKLHDILKLIGDKNKHWCPEWCDEFATFHPDIKKLLKHHCVSWYWTKDHKPGCNPFPIDQEMLCIHLADVKAATISRKLRTSKYKSHKTFRIWKETCKSPEIREKEKNDLAYDYNKIVTMLSGSMDLNELYQELKNDFLVRSEDAGRCPFASLHTHNELTALWFAFFLNNPEHLGIPQVIEDSKLLRKVRYDFCRKQVAMVRLKLKVNTRLSRLRDAKLIKDVPELFKKVSKELNGIIIYNLSEEILVITNPNEADSLGQKIKDVLGNKTNYYFETTVVKSILSNKEFLHNYNKLFGNYQDNLYPELQTEITTIPDNEASHRAIICDMCQMSPASKIYPQEVYDSTEIEPVEEFLCEGCLEVRREANKATNLAKWENEEDASVAFFKVTLNMPELINLLKEMFINTFGFNKVFDEDLGFSIIKEFLYDYTKFLETFKDNVFKYEDYGDTENNEIILDNLFCIKIKKAKDIKPLVMEYTELLCSDDFFVQMVSFAEKNKRMLPIKLSITTSNVKYPFIEHWQILDSPKEDINVYAIPHTRLSVSLSKYLCLKDAGIEDKDVSSALHKLAEIEEKTKNSFLVTVSMLERKMKPT
ncbi:MAG: hypothetical protein ABIF11_05370 [Nitrospirota bacterium]